MATPDLKMARTEVPAGRITRRPQKRKGHGFEKPAFGRARFAGWFFRPALGPVLRHPCLPILLAGLAAIQIGLTAAGWPSWQCPIYAVSGLPCPGCGLSRAAVLLAQGQWKASIQMHAFAPAVMLGLIGLAVAGVLPPKQRQDMILAIAAVERRTGMAAVLVLAMLIYWGMRVTGLIAPIPAT
jgi:hypothetical protein